MKRAQPDTPSLLSNLPPPMACERGAAFSVGQAANPGMAGSGRPARRLPHACKPNRRRDWQVGPWNERLFIGNRLHCSQRFRRTFSCGYLAEAEPSVANLNLNFNGLASCMKTPIPCLVTAWTSGSPPPRCISPAVAAANQARSTRAQTRCDWPGRRSVLQT